MMARTTIDELGGYGMAMGHEERQVFDQGMPVFNGSGEPKMHTLYQLVFTAQKPDGDIHIVKSPWLDRQSFDDMYQAVTGVVPANALTLPPGIEL